MGLIKEFKTFIVKGNAIDMAVGIIIGAAFGLVVRSLVDDIIMPPLGYVLGGIDFSSKVIGLAPALEVGQLHPLTGQPVEKEIPAVVIRYGAFINALITLLIQGFAIFMVVKTINRLNCNEDVAVTSPAIPSADLQLLTEMCYLLK